MQNELKTEQQISNLAQDIIELLFDNGCVVDRPLLDEIKSIIKRQSI